MAKMYEAMSKDVECAIGILKKRFPVLKYGIRVGKVETFNNIVHGSAILHNMLLWHDGLCELDFNRVSWAAASHRSDAGSRPVATASRPDVSQLSHRATITSELGWEVEDNHLELQQRLEEHFTYMYRRHLVEWPEIRTRDTLGDEDAMRHHED